MSIILAALLAAQAVEPFNGKDLAGWKLKGPAEKSKWKVGKASLDPAAPAKFTVAEGNELVNAAAAGWTSTRRQSTATP